MNNISYLNNNRNPKSEYLAYSLLTFISPMIGIVLIGSYYFYNMNRIYNKNDKYLTIPLALIFAAYGYCITFTHGYEIDLTVYFEQLQDFEIYKSVYPIWIDDDTMLYTRDLLFFIISRTHNVHILPFVVGLCIYGIVFYVFYDILLHCKIKLSYQKIVMLIVIMIGLYSPFSIIGNVRCIFSFTLILFAVYRDMVQKNRNLLTILLYVIPIGLHTAAISVLIVRILQYFVKYVGIYISLFALGLPSLITILHDLNIGGFVGIFLDKAYFYLNWTEGGFADMVDKSIWSKLDKLFGTIYILTIIVSIFIVERNNKRNKLFENGMIRFLVFIGVYALGSLYIKTGAFWRYAALFALFSPCIILPLLESKNKKVKKIFIFLFYFSIMTMFYSSYKTYKMSDMIGSLENYISFSGFDILYSFF